MKLRLGTRGSALAVAQSEQVAGQLRQLGHEVELVRIKTGGDVARGSLTKLDGLGVFAAELRNAILDGRCDFAVHSFKDLPTAEVPGLVIAATPRRADARDALCAAGSRLRDLPSGASVGTGSPRRVAQLRALRPDLRYVDVRGNVGTRLARVSAGDLDAVVLAVAGLQRLGHGALIDEILPIIGAPGQGALALECRANDPAVLAALLPLNHAETRLAVEEERAVLAGLGGGCAAPIAAHATINSITAGVFALDGRSSAIVTLDMREGSGAEAVAALLASDAAQVTDLSAHRPSRLAELHDGESLWRGDVSLAGRHILLPRSDGELAQGLRAAGAEVTCAPVLKTIVLNRDVDLAADWVVFTSPRAVAVLGDLPIPAGTKLAAVGAATARALERLGHNVTLRPAKESSAAALVAAWPAGSGKVLIPGSARSASTLADGLRAKGYLVEQVASYDVAAIDAADPEVLAAWQRGDFDTVVITSGSVGEAFGELFGWRDDVAVVAFGKPSHAALQSVGVHVAGHATTQDAQGIAQVISQK